MRKLDGIHVGASVLVSAMRGHHAIPELLLGDLVLASCGIEEITRLHDPNDQYCIARSDGSDLQDATNFGFGDMGGSQVGGSQVGESQVGGFQVGESQAGGSQVGGFQVGESQVGGSQVGEFQVGESQVGEFQVGGSQAGIRQPAI